MLHNMYSKIAFIGQAPAKPGSKHQIAGSYLYPWLYQLGMTQQWIEAHCHFYALTGEFPGAKKGSHLPPTATAIAAHLPNVTHELQKLAPTLVVPVGKLAIHSMLPEAPEKLADIIGQEYFINPYVCLKKPVPIVPLPHPSGRSTWIHTHPAELAAAFKKLQCHFSS
jgi:uracil-DNA glycosylase